MPGRPLIFFYLIRMISLSLSPDSFLLGPVSLVGILESKFLNHHVKIFLVPNSVGMRWKKIIVSRSLHTSNDLQLRALFHVTSGGFRHY